MVVFDPMEAKGPTVLFFKVTPSPIKQGSMIFELIELTVSETKVSLLSFKKPNMRRLVSIVTSLFPQSIHSSTVPVLKTFPWAIIRLIPSFI